MSVDREVSVEWVEDIREEAMGEDGALDPEQPTAAAVMEVRRS